MWEELRGAHTQLPCSLVLGAAVLWHAQAGPEWRAADPTQAQTPTPYPCDLPASARCAA